MSSEVEISASSRRSSLSHDLNEDKISTLLPSADSTLETKLTLRDLVVFRNRFDIDESEGILSRYVSKQLQKTLEQDRDIGSFTQSCRALELSLGS